MILCLYLSTDSHISDLPNEMGLCLPCLQGESSDYDQPSPVNAAKTYLSVCPCCLEIDGGLGVP